MITPTIIVLDDDAKRMTEVIIPALREQGFTDIIPSLSPLEPRVDLKGLVKDPANTVIITAANGWMGADHIQVAEQLGCRSMIYTPEKYANPDTGHWFDSDGELKIPLPKTATTEADFFAKVNKQAGIYEYKPDADSPTGGFVVEDFIRVFQQTVNRPFDKKRSAIAPGNFGPESKIGAQQRF